jgi:mannose-6-phosphate isomerase-like protein (cupin superfamily)
MRLVSVEAVEHAPHPRDAVGLRRLLGSELDTDELDLTHFELAPGEQFSGAYHRHLEREEVFYLVSGTATFETEAGEVTVSAGEAIRFAPGDWQLGRNDGSDPVEALLVGSPKQLAPVEARLDCPDCETETTFRVDPDPQDSGDEMTERRRCLECGASFET